MPYTNPAAHGATGLVGKSAIALVTELRMPVVVSIASYAATMHFTGPV